MYRPRYRHIYDKNVYIKGSKNHKMSRPDRLLYNVGQSKIIMQLSENVRKIV